jgi:hypothetical protein
MSLNGIFIIGVFEAVEKQQYALQVERCPKINYPARGLPGEFS